LLINYQFTPHQNKRKEGKGARRTPLSLSMKKYNKGKRGAGCRTIKPIRKEAEGGARI